MKKFLDKVFGTNTKLITWFTAFVWGATVGMAIASAIVWNVDLVSLVISVSASYGIVLTAYMSKSFLENKEMNKIKETLVETIEDFKEEI